MCKPVVVVLGKTGAGKDTLAKMLTFQDDSYRILKCSEKMKRDVAKLYDIDRDLLEHRQVKNSSTDLMSSETYLDVMVAAFHEYGHKPKNLLLSQIQDTHHYNLVPVITDVRHPNELSLLENNGYYIILVRVLSQRAKARTSDTHVQSIWYDGVEHGYPHMTVWNNDDLCQLLWYSELAHRYIQGTLNTCRNCSHETTSHSNQVPSGCGEYTPVQQHIQAA